MCLIILQSLCTYAPSAHLQAAGLTLCCSVLQLPEPDCSLNLQGMH